MAKTDKQNFDHLSPAERAVVGEPDDYDWDAAIQLAPRARPEMAQFSLRVERQLLEAIQAMAQLRKTSVSDIARGALEQYLATGGMATVSKVQVTFGRSGVLLQVEGQAAELPSSYRSTLPGERVEQIPAEPVTAGTT